MSGIAGAWYLDGRPARPEDIERMVRSMSHRGPDGHGTWCRGHAALGHGLLRTTPESMHERLPLSSRDGSVVLTADARIDNRADLLRELEWRPAPQELVPDSRMILGAYERWGVACTDHLVGDFAFAIWDGRRNRLFCCRDHFGVKPFYYHCRPGRLFAFASEIKGLLALPEVPRLLNETRVADYLRSSFDDEQITFYDGILRLPPGHRLLVTPAAARLERYWSLDPFREVVRGSDQVYAEEFREIFFEAVRCRLRSAFPVGSSLSGGLDSSSIVCTARALLHEGAGNPLHTFSLVFDGLPRCDERPFIDAVLAGGDLVPHFIRGDRISPMEDLDAFLRFEDEASWVCNMCLHWAMHRCAAEQGVRVFLDGLGGDEVVSHGIPRLAELLRSGRLPELAVSVARLGTHFRRSPIRILGRQAIRPLLPPALRRAWTAVRGMQSPAHVPGPLVSRDLAERTSLLERQERRKAARPRVPKTVRGFHYLGLVDGITSAGFESLDRVGASFSLEPRYPFHDKRLVEYCLALPGRQKFRWGWTRLCLRHAMEGTLPEPVRWRGGKADLSAQFVEGFLGFERNRIEGVVFDHPEHIAAYVDVARLRDIYRAYAVEGSWKDAELLWRPVMLAIWLRHAGFLRQRSGDLVAAGA